MADNENSDGARDGIENWREVWDKGLLPGGRRLGLVGRLRQYFSALVRFGAGGMQRSFNLALLDMMDDRRRDIDSLRHDFQQIARDVRSLEEKSPIAVERNDALFVALDQKIESALSRLRDLSLPIFEREEPLSSQFASDWRYRRLEEALRGPSSEVRASLELILDRIEKHQPVLDVGCGRGELLEICADRGIAARGYDVNERSVTELRERGFEAEVGALPSCLEEIGSESVGSIVAVHVVEHLPPEVFMKFFRDAWRALRPGGLLVVETPNAESLAMTGGEFWRDPTHLAPRHEGAIVTLGREAGFAIDLVEEIHPWDEGHHLSVPEEADENLKNLVARLNEILFAPQDLRVILSRADENE